MTSGGAFRPKAAVGLAANLFSWSPDSRALLVYAEGEGHASRGFVAVDRQGETRRIDLHGIRPETGQDAFFSLAPQAGWLSGSPVIWGTHPGDGQAAWWRIKDPLPEKIAPGLRSPGLLLAIGPDHVIISDGADAALVQGDGAWRRLGPKVALDRAEGPLGFRSTTDPMKAEWTAYRNQTGRTCRIHSDDLFETCLASTSINARAHSWSTGAALDEMQLPSGIIRISRITSDGRRTELLTLNSHLERLHFSPPVRIDNGQGASGWLYLPPGLAPDTKAPLVIIPYLGTASSTPPREMRAGSRSVYRNGQVLAAAGYAVLFPDLPAVDDPSAGLAERILAVADAAAARHPVDAHHIGLWGHSFGAWTAVMAAAQSDRFVAVASLAIAGPTPQAERDSRPQRGSRATIGPSASDRSPIETDRQGPGPRDVHQGDIPSRRASTTTASTGGARRSLSGPTGCPACRSPGPARSSSRPSG